MVLSKSKISQQLPGYCNEEQEKKKAPDLLLLTIPIHEQRKTIIFTSTEKISLSYDIRRNF